MQKTLTAMLIVACVLQAGLGIVFVVGFVYLRSTYGQYITTDTRVSKEVLAILDDETQDLSSDKRRFLKTVFAGNQELIRSLQDGLGDLVSDLVPVGALLISAPVLLMGSWIASRRAKS